MTLRYLMTAAAVLLGACATPTAPEAEPNMPEWRLVIHGGAGVITRDGMSPEMEVAYTAALETALEAGADVLRSGGSALDAVEAAVIPMEDDPLFNAGYGAVMTASQEHELDASIMDGRERNAGAVAGVKRVRNPIKAARAVMERSEHVMFSGDGADAFAEGQGLDMVENSYFYTERRQNALERVLKNRQRTAEDRSTRSTHPAAVERTRLRAWQVSAQRPLTLARFQRMNSAASSPGKWLPPVCPSPRRHSKVDPRPRAASSS